ncbi:3,4-dihydroxy-2-butanone-4-phosphate synthase, partial [Enterobacter hormaechei]
DLHRPGHVFPLRAHPGGLLTPGGDNEANIDLFTLAGFKPEGVLCDLTNDIGTIFLLFKSPSPRYTNKDLVFRRLV